MNQDNKFQNHDIPSETNVTVSLTSYPARIQYVSQMLESIHCQSVSPTRVVLYLASENFINGEDDLPDALLKQVRKGLVEIHWCDLDLKSHKKYYYAMQEYPDDVIITVDDDKIYPDTMIEELIISWLRFPNAVSVRRAHVITFDREGKIRPYSRWIYSYKECFQEPSMQLMGVGGAGILYPPHLFPQAIFNVDAIMENALYADDLWLKAFSAICGIPVVLAVKEDNTYDIDGSQKETLYYNNIYAHMNDESMKKISVYLDRLYDSHDLLTTALFSSKIGKDLSSRSNLIIRNRLKRIISHFYIWLRTAIYSLTKRREKKSHKK